MEQKDSATEPYHARLLSWTIFESVLLLPLGVLAISPTMSSDGSVTVSASALMILMLVMLCLNCGGSMLGYFASEMTKRQRITCVGLKLAKALILGGWLLFVMVWIRSSP